MRLIVAAALALALSAPAGHAQNGQIWSIFNINGNDTGGIIPWSPALRSYGYRQAAQRHCDGYHKIAHITSVAARYGNYVGFSCDFPRNYDPVAHGGWWMAPIFKFF